MSVLRNCFLAALACLASIAPAQAELDRYGVLIGRPASYYLETPAGEGRWPHYVIEVDTPTGRQRAVINMFSRVDQQVLHREVPMSPFGDYRNIFSKADGVHNLPFHNAAGATTGGALDILRHPGLVADIRNTPWRTDPLVQGGTSVPLFNTLLNGAQRVYIFGEPYTNSDGSRGIHDVHQNQGNVSTSSFAGLNGLWQDGALVIEYAPTRIWIPRVCGIVPPCWGGYYWYFPNRTLVLTRFTVQQDFTDQYGHARTPTNQYFTGNNAAANAWIDYGPYYADQFQIELTALSGNPDLYIQTNAPPTESSYRARSMQTGLQPEFIRDYLPANWTYVRVRANAAASSWNIRIKHIPR